MHNMLLPEERLMYIRTGDSRSRWPRDFWLAGITGSNPAEGMDVCLLCLYVVLSCVGRGLCDGLITRPEETYRVSVCM
jgi:hypothetical protein